MHRLKDLLDALSEKHGSDTKAAIAVGVRQQTFSNWRKDGIFPSRETQQRIAAELAQAPAYIEAVILAEQASTPELRTRIRQLARQFAKAASVAAISIGAASFGVIPAPAHASQQSENLTGLCIMSNRRKGQTTSGITA